MEINMDGCIGSEVPICTLVAPSGSYGVNGFVWIDWGTGLSQSVRIQVIRCNHCGQKNYVNFYKLPSVAVIVCQSCGGDLL
jgi:hypothetical protein